MALKENKLRNMILYIGAHPNVINLGQTKLYKLLYFADVISLRERGETISGSDYIKYEHGPVPSRGERTLKKMDRDGSIKAEVRVMGGHRLNAVNVASKPNLSCFSSEELQVLDRTCTTYGRKTAKFLSELSHKEPAWVYAQLQDMLSPDLMLYGSEEDPDGL